MTQPNQGAVQGGQVTQPNQGAVQGGNVTGTTILSIDIGDKPAWVRNDSTFISWLQQIEKTHNGNNSYYPTVAQAEAIINEALSRGIYVRIDPPHPGTRWDIPHLNIGDANVHIPLPSGFDDTKYPQVPKGHP